MTPVTHIPANITVMPIKKGIEAVLGKLTSLKKNFNECNKYWTIGGPGLNWTLAMTFLCKPNKRLPARKAIITLIKISAIKFMLSQTKISHMD